MDPIRIELKDDALGVGKAQEYITNHIESTSKRKALDSEKQMDESDVQRTEREYRAEKKQAIEKELQQVKRAFYCELCDKQYKKVSEYDQHLQSYDHHHKKRFKDMKETTRNSVLNQSEREKKLARERKREEKELKRMQDAMQKKMGGLNQAMDSKPALPTSTGSLGARNAVAKSGSEGGGWATTATSSNSGGWDNTATSRNSGGWATTDTNSGGGWATTTAQSGWSQPIAATTNVPVATKTELTPVPTVHTPAAAPTSQEPKRLSFGMKKLQFGMKKKH